MLRDTFFRVQSYHPYVPSGDGWHAFESDNVFQIKKDSVVKATYSAPSKGIGMTKSVFNTEYCVYENGIGQIKVIDENDNTFTLLTESNVKSLVCFNKSFCVTTFDSVSKIATAKFYIIVGTTEEPFLQLLTTKTLTLPSAVFYNASCKIDTENAFVGQYIMAGPLYYSLKVNKPDTFTNNESDPLNDATFEVVSGSIESQGIPRTGAYIKEDNVYNVFFFYRNGALDYYMTISGGTSKLIEIKKTLDDSVVASGTAVLTGMTSGPGVFCYIDNSTGDSVVIFTYGTNTGCGAKAYTLTNAGLTEIDSLFMTNLTLNVTGFGGLFPYFGEFVDMPVSKSTVNKKFVFDGTTLTNTNATNVPLNTFGSSIKWI